MSQPHNKITKPVLLGTSSTLLGLCLVATAVRFYIRIAVQRKIGWDDGWLIFGLCCLIAGMAVLYAMIDLMYEMESIAVDMSSKTMADIASMPLETVTPMLASMLTKFSRYRTMHLATLVPLWAAACSVKFSFLALFKNLVRKMPSMLRYWWFVVVFNVAVSVYLQLIQINAMFCPCCKKSDLKKLLRCGSGTKLAQQMNHSMAAMVLDIIGDLFILVIPVVIIWQIRIRLSQKIALGFTLCLTIVMIGITVTRMVGLKHNGTVDVIWATYFVVVAAEVGLTLVAATAFRTLYVSKAKSHVQQTITTLNWYHKSKLTLLEFIGSISGRPQATGDGSLEMGKQRKNGFIEGDIPRGTMTGVRTFVSGNGNDTGTHLLDRDNDFRV